MSHDQPQNPDVGAQASHGSTTPAEQPRDLEHALTLHRQAVDELAQFKVRVREVAVKYGERYDMCEALDKALVELGLEPRSREYTIALTVTGNVRIEVEATSSAAALAAAPDQCGIQLWNYYAVNDLDFYVTDVQAETCE